MTSQTRHAGRWPTHLAGIMLSMLVVGCNRGGAQRSEPSNNKVTDIAITDTVIQTGVKHLGINIAGQNYYDSGQMLRNLVFNNPGFEGETWQSILRCEGLNATSCTDPNQWNQWPANFLEGAQFEVISGAGTGSTGVVTSSVAADPKEKDQGVAIHFAPMSRPPELDDFILVKRTIPGNAQAGWWTNASGGGSFATEFSDLAPDSPGKQALKILAAAPGESASVSSYFDSLAGHSFVQLKGDYRLSFRAKGTTGNHQLHIDLRRMTPIQPEIFFSKTVQLANRWSDYSFDFPASESGSSIGTVGLTFNVEGADVLLDDVSLTPSIASGSNPSAFRDEVVDTLRELQPGILRYHDGDHLGSSIDNLIAVPLARVRAGYSEHSSQQDSVPLGLHEFLQLCKVVGAEPWFNMPAGISAGEARNLIEYLAGPTSTIYGAKRAALGQTMPWTSVFPKIHLELGNEEWNGFTFAGSAMPDPVAYGQRAKQIFMAARSSTYYQANKFDLVIGTFVLMPDWTKRELANSDGYDSTAVGPYLFDTFNDATSNEAIFGPMFAQPEMMDSLPSGPMAKQLKMAQSATHPANLSVYETNLGTSSGSVDQAGFDRAVPSAGAGLAVIDHMLLMMRDLGVKDQSIWALPGYSNSFQNSLDHVSERTPLFGVVVDMGGATNLRRPQFLAEELANRAILPAMLETKVTGLNPTWKQKLSANDNIQIDNAHYIQSFAFEGNGRFSLVVLNLSRAESLPVTFSGAKAPTGSVQFSQLRSKQITDSNESRKNVVIVDQALENFRPSSAFVLPPFSMTVLRWNADGGGS